MENRAYEDEQSKYQAQKQMLYQLQHSNIMQQQQQQHQQYQQQQIHHQYPSRIQDSRIPTINVQQQSTISC